MKSKLLQKILPLKSFLKKIKIRRQLDLQRQKLTHNQMSLPKPMKMLLKKSRAIQNRRKIRRKQKHFKKKQKLKIKLKKV